MRRVISMAVIAAIVSVIGLSAQSAARGGAKAAALPVVVFETSKGVFEMELYPGEAPKSVSVWNWRSAPPNALPTPWPPQKGLWR